LALSDPAALAGLVSALYTPGTPEYRGFLTPSELALRFGPSPSTISAAQAYFERFGLTASESPDHLLLTVIGPSAEVGAAFGTTFEEYRGPAGGWFVSHPTPATLPTLAPWSGVYGLGNATPLVPASTVPTFTRAGTTPDAACVTLGDELDPGLEPRGRARHRMGARGRSGGHHRGDAFARRRLRALRSRRLAGRPPSHERDLAQLGRAGRRGLQRVRGAVLRRL